MQIKYEQKTHHWAFWIEFYRIYRICRKLFLVIFIFKITKIIFLQKIQILLKIVFSTFNFRNN